MRDDIRRRLIQKSRTTVRMIHYFQRLSQSLSWFDMSARVSEVVSQVTRLQLNSPLIRTSHDNQALGCEKASVFSFDLDRQELWARVTEDVTIRIPLGSGVAGRCAGRSVIGHVTSCCSAMVHVIDITHRHRN
jgi:hypothetical protein